MKHHITSRLGLLLALLTGLGLAAPAARSQAEDATDTTTLKAQRPAPVSTASGSAATAAPQTTGTQAQAASDPQADPQADAPADEAPANDQLRFNFHGVPLETVLDYLSREAGFVIVKTTTIEGDVDLISHQPLSRDEAVALLNTVLNEKGYTAIRNGRTLTIVPRDEAKQRDIPVRVGNQPQAMPKSDEMITQVIPIRYTKAEELLSTIRDLLPSYATISFNASSNALVLTDTQTGVRRITEIVRALDSSISSISSLRVFNLQFADSKETAELIKTLFATQSTGSQSNNNGPMGFPFPGGFGGGGRRGGGDNNNQSEQPDSAALQAAARVVAAADERTNSVVVAAPDSVMPSIEELITQIDNFTEMGTEVRVFTLRHADATQMATNLTAIFAQSGTSAAQSNNRSGRGGFMQRMMANMQQAQAQSQTSQRRQAATTVLVQADARTNSVVVSAVTDVMQQVAEVIAELDKNPAKSKQVYVYSLKHADPEDVTTMLQAMFGSGTSSSATSTRRSSSSNNNVRNSTSNSNSRSSNSSNSRNSNSSSSSFGF